MLHARGFRGECLRAPLPVRCDPNALGYRRLTVLRTIAVGTAMLQRFVGPCFVGLRRGSWAKEPFGDTRDV